MMGRSRQPPAEAPDLLTAAKLALQALQGDLTAITRAQVALGNAIAKTEPPE